MKESGPGRQPCPLHNLLELRLHVAIAPAAGGHRPIAIAAVDNILRAVGCRRVSLFQDYTYDGTGRVASISHYLDEQAANSFARYSYGYDAASRITGVTSDFATGDGDALNALDALRIETFVFDPAGQLTSREASGNISDDNNFAYDETGNRTSANSEVYDVGPNNRLEEYDVYTYEYDYEGNITSRTLKSDPNIRDYFSWDHRSRLVLVVQVHDGTPTTFQWVVAFSYNNDDLRIRKEVTDPLLGYVTVDDKLYVYDGDQVTMVLDRVSTYPAEYYHGRRPQHRYLYAPGVDQLLTDEDSSWVRWAATDHMGTVRQLVNQYEQVVEHREYDSFGAITAVFDEIGNKKLDDGEPDLAALDSAFAFAGREWDFDAGLYYNRAGTGSAACYFRWIVA